jgi:hypothetical protein
VLWVAIAWGAALVIGLVVLGYCGYEIAWKSRRLRRDLGRIADLHADVSRIQEEATVARQRAAAVHARR